VTLIWFTNQPDPALMFEVQQAGHQCVQADTEALVRGIAAQHPNSVVIVGADVPQAQAREVQRHFPTLHLTPDATARDVIWELSHSFGKTGTMQ
jgi:hypothetical protein